MTQADAPRPAEPPEGEPARPPPPRPEMAEFGRTLRRLRQERGLTQRELAERIGETPVLIGGYEMSVNYYPSPERLAAIADALEVPEAELARFLPTRPETTLLGSALRELREQRGLTLTRLAERSGCDPALIAVYESGRAQPGPEKLRSLAAALRIPQRELRALVAVRGAEKHVSPFGKLLRQTRIARGLGQRELAQRVGLRPGTLTTYETTNLCPSKARAPQLVARLAEALELDPALLERSLSLPRHHPPTRFGHHLRKLRIDRGLTQGQLGAHIGHLGAAICGYEKGKTYPKPSALPALAAALDVEEDELARLLPMLPTRRRITPFGQELRRLRKERGLTQAQLARRIGVSGASITCYEGSGVHPKPSGVAAIAEALGVPRQRLEELLPEEPPTTTLGHELRRLRRDRGLTQRQLAARVGRTQPVIATYELGRCIVGPRDLAALAQALGVPEDQLARLAPPIPVSPEPTPFGRELHRHRSERGLTQEQLARRVGVSPATMGSYEYGTTHPAPRVLAEIEEVLGIAPGELERYQRTEPEAVEFGRKLQRLREERGLTRPQLAARLGWTWLAVPSYELGRTRLDREALGAVARALGVPAEQLEREAPAVPDRRAAGELDRRAARAAKRSYTTGANA